MDNRNGLQSQFNKAVKNDVAKNPKISSAYSWPVVILTCIIFWPIGLFLLWKRVSIDRKASLTTGRLVIICGLTSLAFSLMGLLVSLSEGIKSDDVNMIIFFVAAGIGLLLFGNSMIKNARKYKKYLSIIVNQNMTSIDNIAAANTVSYDEAKKDIQKMIDKGYFSGAYINDGTRELVLPQVKQTENIVQSNYEEPVETKVVTCKNCGANNTVIVGKTSECEFCGSPIN